MPEADMARAPVADMVTPKGDKVSRGNCLPFAPQPRASATTDCAFAPVWKAVPRQTRSLRKRRKECTRRTRPRRAQRRQSIMRELPAVCAAAARKSDNGLRICPVWKAVPRQTRSLRKRRKECTRTYTTEACVKATKYRAIILPFAPQPRARRGGRGFFDGSVQRRT